MVAFSANLGTIDYWSSASNPMYGTLSGDVARSGNTVTLSNLTLSITSAQASWGTSPGWTFRVNGVATTVTLNAPPTSIDVNGTSISVGGSATSASIPWSVDGGNSGNFTVTFPSGAPSGLALSNIVPATDGVTATVSVTAWNGGSSSTRARELSLCTAQSASQRKKAQIYGDTMSSALTVDNTSVLTDGAAFTITPNTRYYLTMWASNGTAGTGNSNYTAVVTLAETPTVTLTSKTSDSATFSYTVPADGGFYNKTLEYSLDGGSTWNTIATITSGSASTGTFTITGLTSGDHTVFVRSRTTSGIAGNAVINWSSVGVRLIASDGTTGKEGTRMLTSVGGSATEVARILVSHNGVATENA